MSEAPTNENEVEIPSQFVIDNLRNEVARLNDERIQLSTKLQFANHIIESLQAEMRDGDTVSDETPSAE